ncbi:hypothetical protein [Streptomyces avermitilis]
MPRITTEDGERVAHKRIARVIGVRLRRTTIARPPRSPKPAVQQV